MHDVDISWEEAQDYVGKKRGKVSSKHFRRGFGKWLYHFIFLLALFLALQAPYAAPGPGRLLPASSRRAGM